MGGTNLVRTKCPGCAGSLVVGTAQDVFTCEYCGVSIQVVRSGDTVSLHMVSDKIARLQRGSEKAAAALALPRLKEELRVAEAELHAYRNDARNVTASYEARIALAGARSPGSVIKILLLAVVSFVVTYVGVGIPYMLTHPGYDPIPLWFIAIMAVAGLGVALVVALGLFASRRAKRRALVGALEKERDVAIQAHGTAGAPAEAKVARLQARLAENRAIVDS